MKTSFDQSECQNLKNALAKEWLETNGLGGFAIALHLQSLAAAASTSILLFLTLWAQWRVHNRNIDVSTRIPGFDN